MADNYLEKRYEEVFGSGARKSVVHKTLNPSLDSLLLRNRSHRSFDRSRTVSPEVLRNIIGVNTRIASARNQQVLRFRTLTDPVICDAVTSLIHMGAALPGIQLPPQGAEPPAYIVIGTEVEESRYVDIDLGISLQSMSLKAVELGFNATIVCAFNGLALGSLLKTDSAAVSDTDVDSTVDTDVDSTADTVADSTADTEVADIKILALLAVGKGSDKIQLLSIKAPDNHSYYRKEGIHYVPKVDIDDLMF